MSNPADVASLLTSPSLTKHKLQVMDKRSQRFGDMEYHFIYLASDAARLVLLLNEKVMIRKYIYITILNGSGVSETPRRTG